MDVSPLKTQAPEIQSFWLSSCSFRQSRWV